MCRALPIFFLTAPRLSLTAFPAASSNMSGASMSVDAEGSDIWMMSAPASSNACAYPLQMGPEAATHLSTSSGAIIMPKMRFSVLTMWPARVKGPVVPATIA